MNFVFFLSEQREVDDYYSDLIGESNVSFILKNAVFKSRIGSFLFRFTFSQTVNSHFKVFWKRPFFKKIIKKINFPLDENLCLVLAAGWYDKKFLNWFSKHYPKVKKVCYFEDTVEFCLKTMKSINTESIKNEFDLVMCYNIGDSKKYGYTKCNSFLSKKDIEMPEVTSDVSFIGQAKDRQPFIEDIYKHLSKNNCKCNFRIVNGSGDVEGIEYSNHYTVYDDFLKYELSANCMLEIIKGDTESETLRCWEAVYYNKKLITNWKGILNFKYYNPKYMQYISKPEEIDASFVKRIEKIDYNYQGDNSPKKMMTQIEELLSK